jgi:hypothetical protein
MLFITAVLGSHDFELRISLRAQWGHQVIMGCEDFAGDSGVLSMLSEGSDIELSDFKIANVTLKGDYLQQVV